MAMATSTGSPRTVAAMTGSPSTAGPVTTTALPPEPSVPTRDPTTALTNTPREPDAETVLEPAAATEAPSTEHPGPRDLVAGSPTACPATTALPGSGTASPPAEAQGTAADSISWGSPPAEKGTGPSVGTVPACSLRIWSLPPNGTRGRALRIECRARCAGNATVRWLRTPVALSQYREEAAGSSSTLQLDHAEPRHQGHYQCILLGHRSQVVSLQLTVSDGEWWSAAPSPVPPVAWAWAAASCVSATLGAGARYAHPSVFAGVGRVCLQLQVSCLCRLVQHRPCHRCRDNGLAVGTDRDRHRVSLPVETIQISVRAALAVGAAYTDAHGPPDRSLLSPFLLLASPGPWDDEQPTEPGCRLAAGTGGAGGVWGAAVRPERRAAPAPGQPLWDPETSELPLLQKLRPCLRLLRPRTLRGC